MNLFFIIINRNTKEVIEFSYDLDYLTNKYKIDMNEKSKYEYRVLYDGIYYEYWD